MSLARRFPHAFEEGSVALELEQEEEKGQEKPRPQWGGRSSWWWIILMLVLSTTALYYSFQTRQMTQQISKQRADLSASAAGREDLKVHEYAVVRLTETRTTPLPEDTVAKLRAKAVSLVEAARALKSSGVVMETSVQAKAAIKAAQDALRTLLRQEYGHGGPYLVEMTLQFPESMPDFAAAGADATILVELAPIEEVPYCVFFFLEVVKGFKSGAFHRNAGHVQQAMVSLIAGADRRGLAWQEYSPLYPHKQFSLGFAGRPGGPAFYISTVDNTDNHGPASQGSKSEADGCFGRIANGEEVVRRMALQPGKSKPSGFVSEGKNFIKIKAMKLISEKGRG